MPLATRTCTPRSRHQHTNRKPLGSFSQPYQQGIILGLFVDVPSTDGLHFQGWIVEPSNFEGDKEYPSIVLLAEAFNVNDWARANAQRYADAGYVVLAPDLYWRQEPSVYLPYSPESQKRARALYATLDFDAAVRDTVACIDYLKQRKNSNGRVGLVGYCLGGKIAFLTGARSTPDAVVGYYSIDLENYLDEVPQLTCPSQFHFGEFDTRVPVGIAAQIETFKQPDQPLEVIAYPAAHGFGRFGQPCFSPEPAALAEQRTLTLFKNALDAPRAAETIARPLV